MSNKIKGEDVEWMADMTSTGNMINYWMNDPAISYLVTVVDPDLKLEDVAANIINNDLELFSDYVLANMVTFDPPGSPDMACMVIRVEPYYIIKLTGDRYGDSQQDIIDDLNEFIKEL